MKPLRYNHILCAARVALLALIACWMPAFAHSGGFAHAPVAGFGAGFVHPLTGIDHLLAMFAIGLWSSRQTLPLRWLTPLIVAVAMAGGATVAWMGLSLFGVEFGIAFSVLLAGVCLCTLVRLPAAVGAASIFALLLLHGNAHGTELAYGAEALQCMVGFMVSSALITGVGCILGGRGLTARPRLLRIAGAAVVACGAGLILSV